MPSLSSSPTYQSVAHEEDDGNFASYGTTATGATDDEGLGSDEDAIIEEDDAKKTRVEGRPTAEMSARLRRAQLYLYFSHAVGQFAEGAWQFAVILFLAEIAPQQSILLVSTYMLATYAAVAVFGSPVGGFIDRANRLRAAQNCIGVQNGSVLMATACCCFLLTRGGHTTTGQEGSIPTDALSLLLLVGINAFGSVAQVLDQAFVVAIERDWIVVLSQEAEDGAAWLSNTNVVMRQIDLTCKVLAPAVAGWIVGYAADGSDHQMMFCDLHGASLLVGVLNVTALLVEYVCTAQVYNLIPALSLQAPKRYTRQDAFIEDEECQDEHDKEEAEDNQRETTARVSLLWHGLGVYMKQPIAMAGLSLALLYLNAMSFGGIMTAYLLWKGMPVQQVGLWRSIASVTGLLGTFAYQLSTKYTTVVNTGQLSTLYLFGFLTLAMISFFIQDNNTSMYLLVISCAASRTGLWVFDITITLLYQEFVPDGVRGLVGGTQQSINSFFVVVTSGLGLFFQRPEQFFVFAASSYLGILMCTVLYTFGIFRRGHLFRMHIDDKSGPA